jgi:hypothetical protein
MKPRAWQIITRGRTRTSTLITFSRVICRFFKWFVSSSTFTHNKAGAFCFLIRSNPGPNEIVGSHLVKGFTPEKIQCAAAGLITPSRWVSVLSLVGRSLRHCYGALSLRMRQVLYSQSWFFRRPQL